MENVRNFVSYENSVVLKLTLRSLLKLGYQVMINKTTSRESTGGRDRRIWIPLCKRNVPKCRIRIKVKKKEQGWIAQNPGALIKDETKITVIAEVR